MPRQQAPNLVGDPYGSPPPPRKQRVRKPKDQLDTIVERGQSPKATSVFEDAPSFGLHAEEEVIIDENGVPKKVQKGQINSLAKMLSALRR